MARSVFFGIFFLVVWGFTGCGSGTSSLTSATTSSTSEASLEEAASSVSSLFSGLGASESRSVPPSLRGTRFTLDESMEVCNSLGRGPGKVIMTGRGFSTTIGSVADQITVDEDVDFCTDSDDNENTGTASDGGPLFAQFMLAAEVTGSCGSDTISMASGYGITRNVDGPQTEIYGRFYINGQALDCTLYLDSTGEMDGTLSTCSDDNHESVSLTTETDCTLSPEVARMTLPDTIEGHFAVSTDEGTTVAYDCHNFRNAVTDANNIRVLDTDCTDFDAYGFNLESFNIGYVVSGDASDWTFNRTISEDDVNNRIKLMRLAGYPVLASIDMLYVEDYDPDDRESVADGASFPVDLIANTAFQLELAQEVISVAREMEDLNVEMLAPLSEPDRVFGSATLSSAFFSTYLSEIAAGYSGALIYIGYAFDSQNTTTYNLSGFDYGAINISPMPSHVAYSQFQTHVQTQMTNLKAIADSFGIPFFISNAGIWGDAIGNSYDWSTQAHALEAFQLMTTVSQSESIAADGIIYWEGASGEVVFGSYTDIADYIATEFAD